MCIYMYVFRVACQIGESIRECDRYTVTNKIAFRTISLGGSEDVVSIRRYNYVSATLRQIGIQNCPREPAEHKPAFDCSRRMLLLSLTVHMFTVTFFVSIFSSIINIRYLMSLGTKVSTPFDSRYTSRLVYRL